MTFFKAIHFLLFLNFFGHNAFSQLQESWPRKCSALRELIYLAEHHILGNITLQALSSSKISSTNSNWEYINQPYSIRDEYSWLGAEKCIFEQVTETKDSILSQRLQYSALFKPLDAYSHAVENFISLLNQVNLCEIPAGDTGFVYLKRLSPDKLPASMPDNLLLASMYILPINPSKDANEELLLMVGLEKHKLGWMPLLILEWNKMEIKTQKP